VSFYGLTIFDYMGSYEEFDKWLAKFSRSFGWLLALVSPSVDHIACYMRNVCFSRNAGGVVERGLKYMLPSASNLAAIALLDPQFVISGRAMHMHKPWPAFSTSISCGENDDLFLSCKRLLSLKTNLLYISCSSF
jgi:hypothetical protein